MAPPVKCYYCKESFYREKEPFVKVNNMRYAHKKCHEEHSVLAPPDASDLKELENYIKQLFKVDYIDAKIRSQLKHYTQVLGYSYSGILKTLKYSIEVKKNSVDKMNGGIGIVSYIYDECLKYHKDIHDKMQANINKKIETYVPQEKKVLIKNPKRERKKDDGFSFLD